MRLDADEDYAQVEAIADTGPAYGVRYPCNIIITRFEILLLCGEVETKYG